jgi:hypothetical protein
MNRRASGSVVINIDILTTGPTTEQLYYWLYDLRKSIYSSHEVVSWLPSQPDSKQSDIAIMIILCCTGYGETDCARADLRSSDSTQYKSIKRGPTNVTDHVVD